MNRGVPFLILALLSAAPGCIEGDLRLWVDESGDGTGAPPSSGGPPSGGPPSGGTPPGGVSPGPGMLLVAIGKMQRITISCDGGRNWILDRSMNDSVRCGVEVPDCDHHIGSGMGVSYSNGSFMATFGWGGTPGNWGSILGTRDGKNWTDHPRNYDTIHPVGSHSRHLFWVWDKTFHTSDPILAAPAPTVSGPQKPDDNQRRIGGQAYLPQTAESGVLLAFGFVHNNSDLDDLLILRSTDNGDTWSQQTTSQCPEQGALRFASRNGTGVLVRSNDYLYSGQRPVACRTTDFGQTWQAVTIPIAANDVLLGEIVYSGGHFRTFGRTHVYTSADGAIWTSNPMATVFPGVTGTLGPNDSRFAPPRKVTAVQNGELVAVKAEYGSYYTDGRFLRSLDGGVTWQNAESYRANHHPITSIAYGWVDELPPECASSPN